MGTVTLQELLYDTKIKLNQTNDAKIAELDSGIASGSPTVASDATLIEWLNEGANRLTRSVFPIPIFVVYNLPLDNYLIDLSLVVDDNGRRMHTCKGVRFNGIDLNYTSQIALDTWGTYLDGSIDTTPIRWFTQETFVGVDQRQSAGTDISLTGYGYGNPMVSLDDVLDVIPDEEAFAVVYYAALQAALKNRENSAFIQRIADFQAEWGGNLARLRLDFDVKSRKTAGAYFAYGAQGR